MPGIHNCYEKPGSSPIRLAGGTQERDVGTDWHRQRRQTPAIAVADIYSSLSPTLLIQTMIGSGHRIKNARGEPWPTGHGYYQDVNLGNGWDQIYNTLVGEPTEMADELEQRVYPMIEEAYISQDMLSPVDAETLADIGA